MAIQNPNSLYSAGNVALDSTPYLRIAMAQKARQQAIDEAAYRHYSQLPDKLNSAGVRAQDWEDPNGNGGIGNNIERAKQFFIQNSKDILRGGQAASAYSRMMQENLRDIQRSKEKGKEELKMGQEKLKPNGWRARERDLPIIHKMNLSIYDPQSKKEDGSEYGWNDLSAAAAPYSAQKQQLFDKVVFEGIKPEFDKNTPPVLDNISGKMYNTFKHKPQDIYRVGEKAAMIAQSDPTMMNYYEDLLHDENAIKKASDILSKVSGTKVEVTTPQQLAAGLAMYKAGNPIQQEETNQELIYKRKLQLQNDRQAAQLKLAKIMEAGKDKRLALMKQYEIPDIYGDLLSAPTQKMRIKDPTFNVDVDEELIDVTNVGADAENDLFGKANNYGVRDYSPIQLGDKKYLKKKNGVLVDDNDKPLDPDAVFAKTFTRLKPSREALAKQKAAKGTTTQTSQKEAPIKVKGKVR